MNEKLESGGFRRRIYWYVLITAIVQLSLGILFEITYRVQLALFFLVLQTNFAYLLFSENGINYTTYSVAVIVGTFFMFLMIVAIGEFYHQNLSEGRSIPPDPLEEARRRASHE